MGDLKTFSSRSVKDVILLFSNPFENSFTIFVIFGLETFRSLYFQLQRLLHGLVDDELFSVPSLPFPETKTCQHLTAPLLFPWQMFQRTFVLPVQTFRAPTSYAKCSVSNHPHSLLILLVRRKFHLYRFFPRSVATCNELLR